MGSEIRMVGEDWPPLEVQREGRLWLIEKPRLSQEPLVALRLMQGIGPPISAEELPGLARFARTSLIRIDCEETTVPEIANLASLPVVKLADDLLAWIRVLTGQYWIGYKESDHLVRYVTIGVAEDGVWKETPTSVGFGLGASYGQLLSLAMWQAIGKEVVKAQRPKPARVFFCDALGEMSEGDVTQAVVALGMCCELEAQALVAEIAETRPAPFPTVFAKDHVDHRFDNCIGKLIRDLGGDSFVDLNPEDAKLVRELYKMRGQAAHSGECTYEVKGAAVRLESRDLGKYIGAVEKLFAWADGQRLKLVAPSVQPTTLQSTT